MGRRRGREGYRKVTTVRPGLFGGKVIETRWVPNTGIGTIVLALIFLWFLFRGC